jgi:hypothetical protein
VTTKGADAVKFRTAQYTEYYNQHITLITKQNKSHQISNPDPQDQIISEHMTHTVRTLPFIVEVLCVSPKAILVEAPKSASLTVPVSTNTLPPFMSLQWGGGGREGEINRERGEERRGMEGE